MKEFKLTRLSLKRVKSEEKGRGETGKEEAFKTNFQPPSPFLENTAAWHRILLWQHYLSKSDIRAGYFWLPTQPEGTHSTLGWCVVHLPLSDIYCRMR